MKHIFDVDVNLHFVVASVLELLGLEPVKMFIGRWSKRINYVKLVQVRRDRMCRDWFNVQSHQIIIKVSIFHVILFQKYNSSTSTSSSHSILNSIWFSWIQIFKFCKHMFKFCKRTLYMNEWLTFWIFSTKLNWF